MNIDEVEKRDSAKKYFLMMCESMALDPYAKCNPELNKVLECLNLPNGKATNGLNIQLHK